MKRSKRGNMLILVVAFLFIVLALCIFALGYAKMVGSGSEQKTAIEAAALAAARDMSKIVVNTDKNWQVLSPKGGKRKEKHSCHVSKTLDCLVPELVAVQNH